MGESRYSINYLGKTVMAHELPDRITRALYGFGHFPGNYQCAPGSWRYLPDTCRPDECVETTVKANGKNLRVCSGCGIVVH